MQPDILQYILTQSGIVIATSAIVLTLARDMFEERTVISGFPPNEEELRVPKHVTPEAGRLRRWLPTIGKAIFLYYLTVAVVILLFFVLPSPRVLISFVEDGTGEKVSDIIVDIKTSLILFVDVWHFAILLLMAYVVLQAVRVRRSTFEQMISNL